MSSEISRRDFLKLVSTTASAAALSSKVALWPAEALSRPVAQPAILARDYTGYIIDPFFDFCPEFPTFREFLSLEGLTHGQIKEQLEDDVWRFEHLISDPDNWTVKEIEEWLDSAVDFDDMSPRAAMKYTQYGPGIELHDYLGWETADDLGLLYIEGEMPGHDFVGVRFNGDIDDLNAALAQHGLNVVIREG